MIDLNGTEMPRLLAGSGFKHYGVNPQGRPLFRCVWGSSRLYHVWIKDDAGTVRKQEFPQYPGMEQWVLERWLPAHVYAGPKSAWDAQNETGISLGPYPAHGEYVGCFYFDEEPPWSSVCAVIDAIHAGDRATLAEKRAAINEAMERKEAEARRQREAIIDDAMPAFGLEAVNVNPARKTPDKVQLKHIQPRFLSGKPGKFFVPMKGQIDAATVEGR